MHNKEDIFQRLSTEAELLDEYDLTEWAIPSLMEYYNDHLIKLAKRAYSNDNGSTLSLAIDAFKAQAKKELEVALNTFFFTKEHWRNGRDLNPYLLTCFRRLSNSIYWDQGIAKKTSVPVCPACRYDGKKEFLHKEGTMLRCSSCTKKVDRIQDELNGLGPNSKKFSTLLSKLGFYKLFALHSKKGLCCPDCSKFIPVSIINDTVICPYPNCIYIGNIAQMSEMSHPTGISVRNMVSLNNTISDGKNSVSFQDLFESNNINVDDHLDMQMKYKHEYDILVKVIEDQILAVKRTTSGGTIKQKLLMYEAFKIMLEKYRDDMISYLVHAKQNVGLTIQAKIFQEYARLVENSLPFTIEKRGKKIDIVSLTSPDLALFEGISTYEAQVNNNYIIPNNTKKEYIGGRNFKNYGRYFIGKIIDIKDAETGDSLKNKIKEYSFMQIQMDKSIMPGTSVIVKHFRILPHYEMHSMVFLQRIRRSIVDSVYFRLHKEKRPIRNSKKNNIS